MIAVVFVLVAAMAAVNGANDVPKGVATLAGAGVTRFRTAILWGTVTTLAGCLCSLVLAERMTKLFSTGIVTAAPTVAFTMAVLAGAAAWVGLATVARLPVSTTHALVGGLVGAGVLLARDAVAWNGVALKVALPLLLSVLVSYLVSVGLSVLSRRRPVVARAYTATVSAPAAAGTTDDDPAATGRTPAERCDQESCDSPRPGGRLLTAAHWLTSGATGFARGLNDAPKIVAIGAFALVPAGFSLVTILATVTAAMAVGSLVGGMRVARRLGCDVVRMSHREGFTANLATATLVGLGAGYGLPMSTTHVSTGAIAGAPGFTLTRLNGRTLRDFGIAWLVTPPFAAAVAAMVFLLAR